MFFHLRLVESMEAEPEGRQGHVYLHIVPSLSESLNENFHIDSPSLHFGSSVYLDNSSDVSFKILSPGLS